MDSDSLGKQIQLLIRASKPDHFIGRGKPCFASQYAFWFALAYKRLSYLNPIVEQLGNRRLL